MFGSLSYDYVYKSDMITIAAVAFTWYNQGIVWQEWPRFLYRCRGSILWLG